MTAFVGQPFKWNFGGGCCSGRIAKLSLRRSGRTAATVKTRKSPSKTEYFRPYVPRLFSAASGLLRSGTRPVTATAENPIAQQQLQSKHLPSVPDKYCLLRIDKRE